MNMEDMVIVSVDDHITEPGDMFDRHLTGGAYATAPKLHQTKSGANYWVYEDKKIPSVGLNAVVGRPPKEFGMEPTSFDQLRDGCYQVDARVADMDVNGVAASLNFGSYPGHDGGLFVTAQDKDRALVHLRAYNDWHVDEWCGAYRDRFIPCGILPTWNMDLTVAEMKRLATKGCHAVSLNENPTKRGLPSVHNDYWNPMYRAASELGMTLCLHIGLGNASPHASDETPIEAWITTMPMAVSIGAADWLSLRALNQYPDLRISLSESGIGWIPYFMERADFAHQQHHAWTHSDRIFCGEKPSEVFRKHFTSCFIDDRFGLKNLDEIGEDNVSYECDYPHSDSLWPNVPERLWENVTGLSDIQIDKITHLNAMRDYHFDLFGHGLQSDYTVRALRKAAAERGIDVSLKSSGGAAPLAEGEEPRPVTSGDVVNMFRKHAEAT